MQVSQEHRRFVLFLSRY